MHIKCVWDQKRMLWGACTHVFVEVHPFGPQYAPFRPPWPLFQKGALPLKTCLKAPQTIQFCPKHVLDALEWVGRPQDPTCENFTSWGPFKGDLTEQGPEGPKWGKMGSKKVRVHQYHDYRYPKAFIFLWSQTHIRCTRMGWEAPGPDL